MKSKNELKANHNIRQSNSSVCRVGKYEVKERIESKSQLTSSIDNHKWVGKYEVKERIESKSQLYGEDGASYQGWQI